MPGFEKSCIVAVGVRRATREIEEDSTRTENDLFTNRGFPDSVRTPHMSFDAHDVDRCCLRVVKGVGDVP